MRTGLAFDLPPDTLQRLKKNAGSNRRPVTHAAAGKMKLIAIGSASPCLDLLGQGSQRQHLGLGHGLGGCCTVSENTGQLRNLSQPAAIVFAFDFKRQLHEPGSIPDRAIAYTRPPMQA